MEINKQHTPIDEPVSELNIETLASISKEIISKTVKDEDSKNLLNRVFEVSQRRLNENLKLGNPASWLLEAYKQTFLWTAVYREPDAKIFTSPKELAPVGRFGWRFVIETILINGTSNTLQRRKPSKEEVGRVFTILSVMAMAAEYSNFIHFFPDIYGNVRFDLSEEFGLLMPILPDEAEQKMIERSRYMKASDEEHWKELNIHRAAADEQYIKQKLSEALLKTKGFSLNQVNIVFETLKDKVLNSGYVLIIPGEYLLDWVSDESKLPRAVVIKIMNFILLSSKNIESNKRSFLDKKDPIRMINFAGIRIDHLKYQASIYPKNSLNQPHIKKASWHVIINIFLVAEWHDVFMHRCRIGQRTDLKSESGLNLALEEIEQYQRINVFESVVTDILHRSNCVTLKGIKKWRAHDGTMASIPCGEIDLIAYNKKSRTIYIIECKATAPVTDSRGQSQQYRDHFVQKKYHSKFIKKINWVKEHLRDPALTVKLEIDNQEIEPINIAPILVTRYPSIIKFYSHEYQVVTYSELYKMLTDQAGTPYKQNGIPRTP